MWGVRKEEGMGDARQDEKREGARAVAKGEEKVMGDQRAGSGNKTIALLIVAEVVEDILFLLVVAGTCRRVEVGILVRLVVHRVRLEGVDRSRVGVAYHGPCRMVEEDKHHRLEGHHAHMEDSRRVVEGKRQEEGRHVRRIGQVGVDTAGRQVEHRMEELHHDLHN